MKTYFKSLSLPTFLGVFITIGLTTVSCTSVNSSYYDTDGIYNKGKIKAPVTYNETSYYESYFDEKKNESFETFTDIETYSSYENGNHAGWGEKNSNTNIFINTGYSPYWGWNNYGYGGSYWGFGFGSSFGWGNPYFGGGFGYGWGNPYYGGGYYGWGNPYYGNYNRRNVSYSSNTRTPSNGYRNISSTSRSNNNNLNRNNRAIIQDSRDRANRLDVRSSSRMDSRSIRSTDSRNSNTRDNIRNTNTRDNFRNSTPTRSSNISTPTRSSSSPAPRMGGSSSGGGRTSSGRR